MRRAFPLALLLLTLTACGGDDSKRVVTLEDLWPHEDGRQWTWRLTQTIFSRDITDTNYVYPDSADVPPPPTLDEIRAWLDHPVRPASLDSADAEWILRFEGFKTTETGMTGQNLVSYIDGAPLAAPGLREIPPIPRVSPPTFLRGGVWVSNGQWIGHYGSIDRNPSWRYLDHHLSPGLPFELVLPLGGRLTGWIVSRQVKASRPGPLAAAPAPMVECVYRLDLGVWREATVYHPEGIGWRRDFLYGRIRYMPGVGPVELLERMWLQAGDPDGFGYLEHRAELVQVTPGPAK